MVAPDSNPNIIITGLELAPRTDGGTAIVTLRAMDSASSLKLFHLFAMVGIELSEDQTDILQSLPVDMVARSLFEQARVMFESKILFLETGLAIKSARIKELEATLHKMIYER